MAILIVFFFNNNFDLASIPNDSVSSKGLIHLLLLLKLSAICETKFHYQDKIPPMSYIVDIASNMQVK